jgi:hypothetical protein
MSIIARTWFSLRTSRRWNAAQGAVLYSLLLLPVWAQDQPPQDQPPQDQQSAQADRTNTNSESSSAKKNSDGTSHDRLFFALPNFLTLENASDAPPLTASQKFHATARGTFDPVEFFWYGAEAGISQARDSDPSYGEGAEGYAKRYAVRFADGTVENFFTHAIFPSVLHQDPRYFQLGKGSFGHRAYYAASRIFITRSDSGKAEFNFSEVLGAGSAAAASNFAYHPEYSHNLHSTLDVWRTQVSYDMLSYFLKEFWPDIRKKVHPDQSGQSAAPADQAGH